VSDCAYLGVAGRLGGRSDDGGGCAPDHRLEIMPGRGGTMGAKDGQ